MDDRLANRLAGVRLPLPAGAVGITPFVNKVFNGDAREFLARLPDGSVDMVITSPPYNFKKEYEGDGNADDLDVATYLDGLLKPVIEHCYRVLKTGGRMAINIQPSYASFLPTHVEIVNRAVAAGFSWRTEFVWIKNNYSCSTTSWGSYKSPSNPYVRLVHEFIEVFDKGSRSMAPPEGMIKEKITDITKHEFVEWTRGDWSISPERGMGKFGHPAMFPIELPFRLMKLYTYTTAIILDPFAGVGTTGVAAAMTRRKFICIEMSKKYCDVARRRIAPVLAQQRLDDYW